MHENRRTVKFHDSAVAMAETIFFEKKREPGGGKWPLYGMEMLEKDLGIDEVLVSGFGYDGFRPGQREIIKGILAGGDRIVVLPTGGGKSLCYLLPALLLPGKTLVASPLIALIGDQVARAGAAGLKALYWTRETTAEELAAARIVFASPERLLSRSALASLPALGVAHLVVDEAHCIGDWGGSFRPMYSQLATVRRLARPFAVSVFTASADREARQELVRSLELSSPAEHVAGFDRPNIAWHVLRTGIPALAAILILRALPGRAIVYCRTRLESARMARALQCFGFLARPFHAGMRPEIRAGFQAAFAAGDVPVLCATSAFGMGVDVPGVRTVIHLGLPATLNGYYQESGRAGRDGEAALAVILARPEEKAVVRDPVVRRLLVRHAGRLPARVHERNLGTVLADEEEAVDAASLLAFLLHGGIYRRLPDGMLVATEEPGRALETALKADERRASLERDRVAAFVRDDAGCRRRALLSRYEDASGVECGGCDCCGSPYSELLEKVGREVNEAGVALDEYRALPWHERETVVAEGRDQACLEALLLVSGGAH